MHAKAGKRTLLISAVSQEVVKMKSNQGLELQAILHHKNFHLVTAQLKLQTVIRLTVTRPSVCILYSPVFTHSVNSTAERVRALYYLVAV